MNSSAQPGTDPASRTDAPEAVTTATQGADPQTGGTGAAGQALPTPAERPDSDVVIYDGQCVFCRGQVERLHRWDSRDRLSFLSLHDPEVARRYPDLHHDDLMRQLYVVTPEGRRFGGAAAGQYLARRLPRLYPLYPILNLPLTLPLWSWIYRQIAKRRYKLAGKTTCENDACEIHFR